MMSIAGIRRAARLFDPKRLPQMSDEELERARSMIAAEYLARASRATAQAELRRIADEHAAAVEDDAPLDHANAPAGTLIGPGQRIRYQGAVWKNASTAFLPLSVTPTAAPDLWVSGVVADTI